MSAGAVRASLEHQSAIRVPLGEQVGQAPPVALLVHGDAVVLAANRASATRDRPCVSAPQAARKSRGVRSTERLFSPSALSFLPSQTPGQPGWALSVWAHPAAAERYVFGRPDTLNSSAGSTSSTVASLAMISSPG